MLFRSQARVFTAQAAKVQVHGLLAQARQHQSQGRLSDSAGSLRSALKIMRENRNLFSLEAHTATEELLLHLAPAKRATDGLDSIGLSDRFFRAQQLTDPLAGLVGSAPHTVRPILPRFAFQPLVVGTASRSVANFAEAFVRGVREPFSSFRAENSPFTLGTTSFNFNSATKDGWLKAPKEKRIFVVGARSDADSAKKIRERFTTLGYKVFFYQDCLPLCSEQTVGAFFGTSGTVVHIVSPESQNSPYVPIEITLIGWLITDEPSVVVFSGDEARRLVLPPGSSILITDVTSRPIPDSSSRPIPG